jgi:hypothetical protein
MNMSWPELLFSLTYFQISNIHSQGCQKLGLTVGMGEWFLKIALLPAKHLIRSELRHIESRPFLFRYCIRIFGREGLLGELEDLRPDAVANGAVVRAGGQGYRIRQARVRG